MEHIRFLLDISELNSIFKDSNDLQALLQNVVIMVAEHMKADVCSIYFFDENKNELVLKANVGFSPESIDNVKMNLGEGIAGACLDNLETVCTNDSFSHPKFKYFKSTNEELYKSFLAVPLLNGNLRTGVLVLQRKEENHFVENDMLAVRVIASQLSSLIENIRLMTLIQKTSADEVKPVKKPVFDKKLVKGKSASRGYAYAPVIIFDEDKGFKKLEKLQFEKYSIDDFNRALKETEHQIELLQKLVEKSLADAASMIFTSHLLILKDKLFLDTMTDLIAKGKNPPEAVIEAAKKFMNIFLKSSNAYMREKSKDIEDLAVRMVSNIIKDEIKLPGVKDKIVIAKELFPSDTLLLSSEQIKGAVVISGGITSHVSILSRSLGIPMVISNDPDIMNVNPDAKIMLDADLGNIYINPAQEILTEFKDKIDTAYIKPSVKMLPETLTKDGKKIYLMANVNLLKDLDTLSELKYDGIGLYRSEFPFIIRSSFPSEEEQYFVYKKLVDGVNGKEITFRTLDIGGDKMLAYSQSIKKENPFLGLRSIRYSLKNKDVFKSQIKAVLRAGYGANLRIMFPMVFSIEEFNLAKDIVKSLIDELKRQGIEHNSSPKIGMMVEIPAVIDIIQDFAKAVDFFSIGTNDLVQYMLAVDRNNEEVSDYYIPHHPSVLRAIKKVADAALETNIDVSVCGDMTNSAKYIAFLIGAGIRKLSMNPGYLYENQKIILSLSAAESEVMAADLLQHSSIEYIEKILNN